MKRIISSSVKHIHIYTNNTKRSNDPVNLDNVTKISCQNKLYDITFNFVNNTNEVWLYETREERDKDFNIINELYIYNLGDNQ